MNIESRTSFRTIAGLLAFALVLGSLDAQQRGGRRRNRGPSSVSKNHNSVKAAFRTVVARAREGTVEVLCAGKRVALGTALTLKKGSRLAR